MTVLGVAPAHHRRRLPLLKDEAGFNRLSAVTAVDWWPREPRFEVIYLLHSLKSDCQAAAERSAGEGKR